MDSSPFDRSSRTARSPPRSPAPQPMEAIEIISTSEIQNWMTSIEQCLHEVCSITAESKLNSEQKLRVSSLCRKVGHGSSQMAVQYQALKQRALQTKSTIQHLENQIDLSQKLTDLRVCVEESTKPAISSFADMVKKGPTTYLQPSKLSSVAIYPNDKLKSSEDTKSLVQKIICPEQMKLHVRGMRKTRNGGVIISTDTKEDIDKLKQSAQLTNSGLMIDEPYKRKPKVVIIGVPTTMQEKDIFSCLYHQNLADKLPNYDLDKFLSNINLSHKSGKKDAETCNYVIEVTADIRKALVFKERVFVNWSSCPVRDFTLVTRCFKCQQYGHAAKSCRESSHTCGHCGGQGHSIKECTNKADAPKCATCGHFKKPNNHNTGAADCPAKLMAEKRYINSIDYGGA